MFQSILHSSWMETEDYAAQNGEIYAKFYIRYSFSEEFTMLLPALKSEGIVPLVYTSDPNISNELLRRLTAGADCIRAVKRIIPGSTDEKLHNRVSSGMVTIGDRINMINLLLLSKKYSKFMQKIHISEFFTMGLGALIGGVVSLTSGVAFPFASLAIWQLFWCIVLRFASKNVFLRGKKKNNESDEK